MFSWLSCGMRVTTELGLLSPMERKRFVSVKVAHPCVSISYVCKCPGGNAFTDTPFEWGISNSPLASEHTASEPITKEKLSL